MFKKLLLLMVCIFSISMFSGCVFKREVSSNEIGLLMADGVKITEVVTAGRHTNMGWYAKLIKVDTSAKTTLWEDSDLWTKDKQSVKFGVSIVYARQRENIEFMWEKYNLQTKDDAALEKLVLTKIPRVAKAVTTSMTLDEMLGIADGTKNRETLQTDLFALLKVELAECGIELIDVGVNDIGVDETYAAKLKEKATAQIQVELSKELTKQMQEQINQEKAQTDVAMEIAERNNKVAAEEAKVYAISPEAYELERLRLLKDVVGDSSKIYFIPEGADITLYLAGENSTPPIVNKNSD